MPEPGFARFRIFPRRNAAHHVCRWADMGAEMDGDDSSWLLAFKLALHIFFVCCGVAVAIDAVFVRPPQAGFGAVPEGLTRANASAAVEPRPAPVSSVTAD
ncbi:hypothetical protein WS67_06600 [Burkholderia singularis]|uniref:Uncharacterized protein n=1 Tax=Burkholderia singularis TaxID=1503053 RepID=A0A103E4W2_9BURK|nr:hypothetical protein WS67_06600 [Burkholderia singularis]